MSIGDLLELSRRNEELEKKLALAVEALRYYENGSNHEKIDTQGFRKEFGCGCCARINGIDGDWELVDIRVLQGLTAREALAEIEEIDAQKIRALEDAINHDHFNFQGDE